MGEDNKKSKELFWNFFENHPDYCYMVSLDGEILDVNFSALSGLGYNKKELIGKPVISTVYSPSSQDKAKKLFSKWKKTGELVNEELNILTKDGQERTVLLSADSIRGTSGDILHSISIQRDITDLKKAEEDLKIKNNAIESSLNAIAIADLDGNLTYVNPSFLEMWKYDSNEIIGKPLVKFWQRKGKIVEIIDFVLKNGKWQGEFTAENKEGKLFTVELLANLVKNDGGRPICMMASFIDITHRKIAEEEIIKTKDHLQNIINSASEFIITIDNKNKITTWNKTAERLTGYKRKEVIGKNIEKLNIFEKSKEISNYVKNICSGSSGEINELVLRSKDGSKKILNVSTSSVKCIKNICQEILFIGKDVTYEVKKHGKLVRGNSYIISDENNDSAFNLFIDLARYGSKGLCITRRNPKMIKTISATSDVKTVLLNQDKIDDFETVSEFDEIIKIISNFSEKNKDAVILLERIDYLLNRFSFEKFIDILYQINLIMLKNNSLLLVCLNPSFVTEQQLAFIEAELQALPGQKIENLEIGEELFDILEYIYTENNSGLLISHKKISQHFSIVKSTTAKRLKILEDEGLIYIKKCGRVKIVNISEKGENLIHKRQRI